METFKKTESLLLYNLPDAKFDKHYQKNLQETIADYFEGVCIDLCRDFPVNVSLGSFGKFGVSVLSACRDIKFGQTTSYTALANQLGHPAACRAVGNALAKNPLPLIIPCHRVIHRDGKMGGFSAAGGITMKKKLLLHESIWNAKNPKI